MILIALFLRVWQLNSAPPGLWFDEAYNGMDALWSVDTNSWPVFLVGNNGREIFYHYLLIISTSILGETPYSLRIVSVLVSIVTLPLLYRWILTLFADNPDKYWLALISMTGLATSFWYLTMNRAAYRANLLPLFVIGVSYFFWLGWTYSKLRYYVLAGALLGFSQYTYLSARLLPLVFGLFLVLQTLRLKQMPSKTRNRLRGQW
ncbi:MAG: glycosyltransferase family 39 protein, partial [Chloroflexota bacterium]